MAGPVRHESSPTAASAPDAAASSPTESKRSEEPYSIFDHRQRTLIVFLVSIAATFSGFASNIYFPALPTIAADFKVSSELINLTVTTYLILQGLAPSLWGPISDARGRRVAYIGTFCIFLAACIGLALSRTYAALIVLRGLQSAGSASTIAVGSGVVGDVSTRANRGGLMAVFQAGMLVPVAIGPIIGGVLAGSSLGWRSIFWFLAIYSGVFLLFLIVLLPETLRALVGNGGRNPQTLGPFARYPLRLYQKYTKVPFTPAAALASDGSSSNRKKVDVLASLRILFSKQAGPVVLFLATYYAGWQMCITAMSTLFASEYDLSETQIGLTFISNGIGSIVGTLIAGKLLDMDYRRVKNTAVAAEDGPEGGTVDSHVSLEKARLRLLPIFATIQCGSLLMFGWTIDRHVHIAAPIVSTFITGWTAITTQTAVSTYLVDVFHAGHRAAAAGASINLARCLLAAGGTTFIMPLINRIGTGLAFTVCASLQFVALAGLAVQWQYGAAWREEAIQKQKKDEDGQDRQKAPARTI
ncbi:MFS multidrug transporter [Sporothrix schenckii 1099-18]|uniref:MFS multidrug transporter n=1 Tax=Sporothrix schenckii 1099-18 TaxID=1397361 RepID=A0A0F2MCJ2_SPOSC|nr:MFS multidrug transporter [Sporothrix schenckii 1099-18]KJR87362.1 MFS multidrug transporter [Sporothrix schenckii 1099-18]